jgi:2-polyprenyl-3-methyl-5-hydroxy-6-metoxy-1,4-benzoquinol methylase
MKETKPWFQVWFNKEDYHTLYGHRDVNEAKTFISSLNNYIGQKGLKILDAGCGAGRHVHAWSELGHDAHGFDLSPNSIHAAKEKALELTLKCKFEVLDLRDLHKEEDYAGKFDIVTNLFTSFGYFTEEKDHLSVIKGFAQALKSEGILIMDYLNPEYSKSRLIPSETITRKEIEFIISRHFDGEFFNKTIKYTENSGKENSYTERVKAWEIDELKKLLSSVGLQTQSCFGDYSLVEYATDSPRMIVIAKKLK